MKPSWITFAVTALWLAFFISPFANDLTNMLLCAAVLLSFFALGCFWQHQRSVEKSK